MDVSSESDISESESSSESDSDNFNNGKLLKFDFLMFNVINTHYDRNNDINTGKTKSSINQLILTIYLFINHFNLIPCEYHFQYLCETQ